MTPESSIQTPFDRYQSMLLSMGCCVQSVEELFELVVTRLSERPEVALARIWLVGDGDRCGACRLATACDDKQNCLHLVASGGRSRVDPAEIWDDDDLRIPFGVRPVGEIGSNLERIDIPDVKRDERWSVDEGWASLEGIVAFVGEPLIFRGEGIGVLALFLRQRLDPEELPWLRMIADHAAAAIVTARTFEENARLKHKLELENTYLREEVTLANRFGDIVGHSAVLAALRERIELVAPTDASVLVLGESGTGKELVAREIHRHSARSEANLVRVNCASIPRELYESEFFGHVKGAFTGAVGDRAGRFELADGGTLFLDEVGEIPLELQSKLLRVLQERQYERVGDELTREVDVRVIAATNRNLKREVEAGRFREDLYYRLNVFPIEVPPLRERRDDVSLLAQHFLDQNARRLGREGLLLSRANVLSLQAYDWPGNVRELQNVIERAVITSRDGRLNFDLPKPTQDAESGSHAAQPLGDEPEVLTEDELRQLERRNAERALAHTGGRIYGDDGAARLLGMRPTTLASRLKKWGLAPGNERAR